jgi:hypothetical protein
MRIFTGFMISILFITPIFLCCDTVAASSVYEDRDLSSLQDWNNGWQYRKSHTIEGSLGAGSGYQVKLTVHYGPGVDSGADVFCDSNCSTDFSDIRFTDNDGTTFLDYWMESSVASDYAVFWVKVGDSLNTDQEVYVYYGNPESVTTSNGSDTFMYFDDFENNNFDAWDAVGADFVIQSTVVKGGTYAASSPGGGSERYLAQNISSTYNGSFLVHTWVNLASSGDRSGYPVYWAGILANEEVHTGYSVFGHYADWSHASYSVNPVDWSENSLFSSDIWYRIEVGFDFDNYIQRAWNNRFFMGEIPLKPQLVDSNVVAIKSLSTASGNTAGETMWMDNYYIRKWTSLEPSHGTWGSVETPLEPTTTPTPIPTTTPTSAPLDIMMISLIGGGVAVIVLVGALVCRSRRPTVHTQAGYDW